MMTRTITTMVCAAALALTAAAGEHKRRYPELPEKITAETPAQRDARMAWWRDARFGMFIHFGAYSLAIFSAKVLSVFIVGSSLILCGGSGYMV